MNLPHIASVSRLSTNNGKYIYGHDHDEICFLQPLDAEKSALYGVTFGKASTLYTLLEADIVESDRLLINGTTYGVKAVTARNYGNLRHNRLIIEAV